MKSNKRYKVKNIINMVENNWFKGKELTAMFAAVAFFTGFLFVDRGSISGNTVLNGDYSISAVSLIGLFLVICSVVLVAFALRNK